MTRLKKNLLALALVGALAPAWSSVDAEQLYKEGNWPAVASDNRANSVGDVLTVIVYENAKATNRVQNKSSKGTNLGGGISVGSINESAGFNIDSGYTGRGEVTRSEQLVARMSVKIASILPNGDFLIEGAQQLNVNGETTNIGVKGRIRPIDISNDNSIPSSRIADAKIDYDGKGFVSRSAKPGLINRILSFLGLG